MGACFRAKGLKQLLQAPLGVTLQPPLQLPFKGLRREGFKGASRGVEGDSLKGGLKRGLKGDPGCTF